MVTPRFTHYRKLLILSVFLFGSLYTFGQDVHFSQFRNAPITLNPALTGVFNGKYRVMANYRAQWNNVPVGWSTFNGVFDTQLLKAENGKGFFGLGGVLNFDEAGDSKMGTFNLALNGSYTYKLTPSHWLTAGLNLGGAQRSYETEDLRFDEQYNGDSFDPLLASGEAFSDRSVMWADFGLGLNYHFQKEASRSSLDVGLAGHHLNEPMKSFWEVDDVILKKRITWYASSELQVASKFDVIAGVTASYQDPYTEHILGLGGRIHLSKQATKELAIALGCNYRFNGEGLDVGDAVFPFMEVDFQNWRV
ncbi:MAG: PorP/SprF family type IX secretion system membrane protein, partial [Saprospiraceae bacterium]|nr:PorP/SprF family type IX secretion system membrane protein [Saprospiraceae bacterium]